MSAFLHRRTTRRGFTLIELLLVITIILLISGMFLGLRTGDGGGLPAGQRIIGSSIRSVRAMALMNRGTVGTGISYTSRYRLLILNDPTDPVNHLRQFCIAVGGVTSVSAAGSDPTTITATNDPKYLWFSPEGTSTLPDGVYFIPPDKDSSNTTIINPPAGVSMAAGTRRSIIGSIADSTGNTLDAAGATPPWMMFAPLNQPSTLASMGALGAKKWYYVEIQPTGASNHLGRVMIVLARGSMMLDASDKAVLNLESENQFAALALRPNGDVSFTTDPNEMDTAKLTK
jgi:prepilin-type N-terminal cleavage/methylation domain-containing protein